MTRPLTNIIAAAIRGEKYCIFFDGAGLGSTLKNMVAPFKGVH